ncbi:hypothetical protein J437_LFUL009140 [Ladona fulva]|uniref:NADP-dependent oxidoreductase domain-containing protein n=1 Tax=Ladona fulva TaxID=123851 RepID=A0A8K0K5U9_LADFU|nr:hypothetical protein J437_LFUL009140 [Ladona fulva]
MNFIKSEERGLSRKHVIESVRASLARLQLGYIDVVIVHKADPMCPMEEVVRAMNHVISQGWAMYWGTARWTPVEVMEAYTNCRQFNCVTPICEQAEYHMFCREKTELYMSELYNKIAIFHQLHMPISIQNASYIGVGLMAWSPVTMGLVSGKLEDGMSLFARASFKNKYSTFSWTEDETQAPNKEDLASPPGGGSVVVTSGRRGTTAGVVPLTRPATAMGAPSTPGMAAPSSRHEERLREVAQIAERLGCSVSQLATAWCLKNEAVHCLLLGAASPHQLYENLQSLQVNKDMHFLTQKFYLLFSFKHNVLNHYLQTFLLENIIKIKTAVMKTAIRYFSSPLQLVPKLTSSTMSELERILENKPVRPPIVSTLALR